MTNKVHSLGEIAQALGAELVGDADVKVDGIATLQSARAGRVAFLANPAYGRYLRETQASAVILSPDMADQCPTNVLLLDNPYLGYARLSHWFDPQPKPEAGIHPSAVVDPSASVADSATVGPQAVIEAGATIAENVVIGAGCIVGERSVVGEGSRLNARVTLYHDVIIGKRCLVLSGAVIGSVGFGFANEKGVWHRIAQVGGVVIGDDVEIGANTTIDRGALDDTLIGDGVKLDNLVQIAHNVSIGEHTAMAALVGVAGSTRIGRHCVVGGASGIAGHLEIGDQVHLTGMTMVTRSLKEPGVYSSGLGADSNRRWQKNVVRFRQLDEMARKLRELEKKLLKRA
ncbi:UDP-3-O-(3-hydroxymyristoyl)glucosamine N-acyltransferase [Marinobacter nanhaiticus D15-8W]|uniref:UDP-3-O-acylglucosamine N-acyltransferase n=1 Tax=Marinobacter nanhaiticus D15-8W TaxID=626887 RepID=N6WQV8_9GAMM|nr:UDP-3-O-(3-hydroxymyristoyl)glucosamine N-acyltransferase [Marinobacter nanhaiticus]ENO13447.1 UDP-3-O-(3-hydroxymyristoyl)glucosamine N-acyltransferase [Marinobacter nanhaiticus D15-8W]BES70813.1 UDP-3-O-(3-hydroxymyristoyl)glucosamine N-acyltransferase [Marinobacter nanhaiticus D15-8W]